MPPNDRNTRVLAAESALHDQSNILPQSQLVFCLAILSFSLLISFIDQNGISITLPTIAEDLDATDTISWAGTASLVANTTFQMLYGRLSDIFGRKAVFLGAILFLSLADLLCGLSQTSAMFYVFRGIAGIGSGGITNIAMIIVSDVVTLENRGKYQGIFGTMVGLGNLLGPFIAAAFVKRATWRGFFYMLAPLVALAGVVAYLFLPNKPPTSSFKESAKRIDYLGCFTISLGIIFLLIPISGGGAYYNWDSPMVISMLAIGSLSCIFFFIVEWKVAKLPMMPVTIFANRAVVTMLVQSFIFGAVYQSSIYYIPLYLLNARQFQVLEAAAVSTSSFILQSVTSTLAGLYISHFNRYGEVIWFGFAVWTLGIGLCLTFTRSSSHGAIIGPLMVVGIGVGCIFQPTLVAMQAHSPKSRRAVIISNRNFFRCCGGAVGLAISAAVLQATLRSQLPAEYAYLADSTYSLPPDLAPGPSTEKVYDAYMHASHSVFMMQVPMMGACLLGCLLIKDNGLESKEDIAEQAHHPEESPVTPCDNSRPKCSLCVRNGTECVINSGENTKVSRALIDELEKKEQALGLKLRELESNSVGNDDSMEMLSPEETQTGRSIAGSSPVARGGAGLGFIAHLFADADWRKSHANLLRTLADAPGATEASIAPCSLPSAAETQQLFDKYLTWSHIQSPFLLRREVWTLHHRLFSTSNGIRDASDADLFRAFMICAIASVLPYRNGFHHQHPEGYYHAALQHLGPKLLTRGVDSVQDLLLVCRFGIYHPIGTSIWDVIRLCGRLCIELGLHTEAGDDVDLLEKQRRRRVFWQFYMIDRYSSTTLDRPFLIDDSDIKINFPAEANDDELEAASPGLRDLDSFCSTHSLTSPSEVTIHFVSLRLRQVSSHIHTEFSRLRRQHGESSPTRHLLAGHVHVVLNKLLQELENWRKSTPVIQDPSCLYHTQEWYDLLHARERLAVVRRAIDLVPKVNGSPSKQTLALFLRSALETIERYYRLCQKRDLITHTRSYFHMLFTAGLSVMYCISVSKTIEREDLRASYEGLMKCEEMLMSMAIQLPDAHSYVAVFEALHRDISRKLRRNIDNNTVGSSVDGSLTIGDLTNPPPSFARGGFAQTLAAGEADSMSTNLDNAPYFSSGSQSFNQTSTSRVQLFDPMDQITNGVQPDDAASYQDGSSTVDLMNWALLNYDSLWNMESALGEYAYGDPTNSGIWEGFEF
ncbi:hypothetical protein NM208_g431 [Fusarium decemcellulare]|uniref:Uncharacterized protein n=1 Tax=Fusarium decemcellulare TaxID=57161 RepID=A0ACC1SZC8_9HYPO|nr:hypothetical protein NM208_g431 [Fusarium decemcellulare]